MKKKENKIFLLEENPTFNPLISFVHDSVQFLGTWILFQPIDRVIFMLHFLITLFRIERRGKSSEGGCLRGKEITDRYIRNFRDISVIRLETFEFQTSFRSSGDDLMIPRD